MPWLATAAAVVGLVAVVATGAGVRAERDRLATAMAAQEAVLDRLTDPDAAVVRLGPTRGGAESDGPGMTAAVLMDGGEAWVVTDGLPPNDPAATTYVLWALPQAGDPVPMGVFDVTAGGLQVAGLGAPGAAVGDPPGDLALGDLALGRPRRRGGQPGGRPHGAARRPRRPCSSARPHERRVGSAPSRRRRRRCRARGD